MTETPKRILIVEDDEDIASALSRGLVREGYAPLVAFDIASAMERAQTGCVAAVIDVMLGVENGHDLVRRMRREGYEIPVIMLSALSSVEDRAAGLAAGADDYVAKPFEMSELIARLKVQEARRASAQRDYPEIREDTREVVGSGRSVSLTQREFDLLSFLMARTGEVLSRGEIFDALWLGEGGSSENVVDVYLGYLRRKLSPAETFGLEIRTMRGRGFVLTKLGGS
ncbi:MAG: response regulator transcription factor [Pseudomonadota bacterium]